MKDLYSVFWQFAVTSSNSQLREIPAVRLRDALMDVLLSRCGLAVSKKIQRFKRSATVNVHAEKFKDICMLMFLPVR